MTVDEWVSEVHHGDALELLDEMPAESVHAVVTDPPYGLAFMGRDWDDFEPKEYQEWCEKWARKAKRVLKPGGHLLAFSGNRTHHRCFSGVEDAGFEVRDTITWHYGSGFPKGLDVSKAIDKAEGAEREVVAERETDDIRAGNYGQVDSIDDDKQGKRTVYEHTVPATDAAEKWDGWKTILKPATEYVVVARKPIGEETVVGNVLEHGTGALNIGECRVGDWEHTVESTDNRGGVVGGDNSRSQPPEDVSGRYPSNVVFDEDAAEALDDEVGETETGVYPARGSAATGDTYGEYGTVDRDESRSTDSGGPSRYFYTSKASRSERTLDGKIENPHPTVKPLDLMEWLVTLVSAEGQVVLDPFVGSGTTCIAAKRLGRKFIGMEKSFEYVSIAQSRIGIQIDDPSLVRDDEQTGINDVVDSAGGDG